MKKALINDIIGWDIGIWNKSLEFFEQNIDFSKINNALELGAGHQSGGYSLYLAQKGINTICSSQFRVNEKIKKTHQKYELSNFIEYEQIDISNIPYTNYFDIVSFKSVLGGIKLSKKPLEESFVQITKCLKEDGLLIFSENISSTYLHKILRKRYTSNKHGWHYYNYEELIRCCNLYFCEVNYTTNGFITNLFPERFREMISFFDNHFFCKVIPKNYHYLFIAICREPKKALR